MLISGAYVQYIIHSWNKAAWFISYKNFLKVLALCSLCRLLLYSWIHFSAALVYTNCSIWLLAPHIFAKCLPSSDCSSLLRKKKKKKQSKAETRTSKRGVTGSLGSRSHPCSRSANKNTHRTVCEWQTGTNKVNPKHLLQIQMRICKEVAVFSTSCTACNSRNRNARAVPKEVLTPLLFLVLLLFFIGAHIISLIYMLLCKGSEAFWRLHNRANSVKEPLLAGVRAGCCQRVKPWPSQCLLPPVGGKFWGFWAVFSLFASH